MTKLPTVPRHIAIVMDGNGRWASKRFLPRIVGHRQGVEALKRVVRACIERKVAMLTVFAFSSENWRRPTEEVSGLMDLLTFALAKEVDGLHREGVRLRFVGDRQGLSERVCAGLEQAQQLTIENDTLTLNVCFNYGGRWEIVEAVNRLLAQGGAINESSISRMLTSDLCPDPDLIIRTGGEYRISNFLLWQAAYAELYFSPLLWPDFDEKALGAAIDEYAGRERRFGMTSGQLTS